MGLDGAFALMVFLGATWYGLLAQLISETQQDPANVTLIAAAFAHWLTFLYFCLASAVVYGKGLSTIDTKPAWLDRAEALLLRTWPAAIGSAAIGFLAARLVDIGDGGWIPGVFVPLAWFLVRKSQVRHAWTWIALVAGGFVPYMLVVSYIWAGVTIGTDKPEYKPGEPIVVTVMSEGYVFNPEIRSISLYADGFPKHEVAAETHLNFVRATLRPQPREPGRTRTAEREYIAVSFAPQALWFEKEENALIVIATE